MGWEVAPDDPTVEAPDDAGDDGAELDEPVDEE